MQSCSRKERGKGMVAVCETMGCLTDTKKLFSCECYFHQRRTSSVGRCKRKPPHTKKQVTIEGQTSALRWIDRCLTSLVESAAFSQKNSAFSSSMSAYKSCAFLSFQQISQQTRPAISNTSCGGGRKNRGDCSSTSSWKNSCSKETAPVCKPKAKPHRNKLQ